MASTIDITTYNGNIINGELVPTPTTRHSIDPATCEPLYEVSVARQQDVDAAVTHDRAAFKAWSQTTHDELSALILKYADAVEANRADIEKLQTTEQGKPLGLAHTEVSMAPSPGCAPLPRCTSRTRSSRTRTRRTSYSTHPAPGRRRRPSSPGTGPSCWGLGKVGPRAHDG